MLVNRSQTPVKAIHSPPIALDTRSGWLKSVRSL
jgi:hypothetical protein